MPRRRSVSRRRTRRGVSWRNRRRETGCSDRQQSRNTKKKLHDD